MEFIDYYKVMAIDKSATAEEIKKHTENLLENFILILTQRIKKLTINFSN